MKRSMAGKPHVAIRNRELYEDDGKDYSDYDQVKSWPSNLEPSPEDNTISPVKQAYNINEGDYDVPKPHPEASSSSNLDMVPTKLASDVVLPPSSEVSTFDLEAHQSEYLTPGNKPLEASAIATMKMILMETPPGILAQHIVHLDLKLLKMSSPGALGLRVHCGLELITLPQGHQLRKDALERQVILIRMTILQLLSPLGTTACSSSSPCSFSSVLRWTREPR